MYNSDKLLAKCRDFDIMYDGVLMLGGSFMYNEGGMQGLGYEVDADFIKRFMGVFGVEWLQNVNGEACWVTRDPDSGFIIKIEPLFSGDGITFDISIWQKEKVAEMKKITGIK